MANLLEMFQTHNPSVIHEMIDEEVDITKNEYIVKDAEVLLDANIKED